MMDSYAIWCVVLGIFVVIFGGLLIFSLVKRDELKKWLESPETKEFIKDLCRQAEKYIIGTKQGLKRLEWVVTILYEYVPPSIRKYFTKEMAREFLVKAINIIFDQIAVVMRDGSRKAV